MKLTRGEWAAMLCFAPLVVWFLPPVTGWVAATGARVLGVPLLLCWNGLGVAMTAVLMTLALAVKDRIDRS